jgi:hypothetical protein
MKNKTWLWILLGIVAVTFAMAAWRWWARHLRRPQEHGRQDRDARHGAGRVRPPRAQFADQSRWRQIDGRDPRPTRATSRGRARDPEPLSAMHVMVWQESDRKLMRFSLPMVAIRMGKGVVQRDGRHAASAHQHQPRRPGAAGPTLLVDHRDQESRVLVWTE